MSSIKTVTTGQIMSGVRPEQRKGRITKMKAVSTKIETLSRSSNACGTDCLVKTIMGYSAAPTTAAMKHGRTQETQAKLLYKKLLSKRHKCFSTQETGLLVMEQCPYIGATPDLFVQCECHGEGLCEIKCPYTTRDQIPSSGRVLSNFIKSFFVVAVSFGCILNHLNCGLLPFCYNFWVNTASAYIEEKNGNRRFLSQNVSASENTNWAPTFSSF